mgnify:CR=1 FL=1
MKVEEIRVPNPGWGEQPLLAVVVSDPWDYPADTHEHHVTELVPQSEPMQVLAMALPKNHVVAPHTHTSQERTVCTTQETLMVLSGRVSVDFYRANREWFCRRVIGPGDVVILLSGGHGLTVLTPCRLIEVKTGPYYGRGLDKMEFTQSVSMDALLKLPTEDI